MKGCRPLTEAEIKDILDRGFAGSEYELRDKALFILGVKSGLRVTELCKLRVRDVVSSLNADGDCFEMSDRIRVAKSSIKNKREGRSIAFNLAAKEYVRAWIEYIKPCGLDDYLFASQKGDNKYISRQHAWRILKTAFKAVGVGGQTGTHSMRKTFAKTIYLNSDKDLVKTQRALGHVNISSTGDYLSCEDDEVDLAILSA